MARRKKVIEYDHEAELDLLSKYMTYYINVLYKRALGKKSKANSFEDWKSKKKLQASKRLVRKSKSKK